MTRFTTLFRSLSIIAVFLALGTPPADAKAMTTTSSTHLLRASAISRRRLDEYQGGGEDYSAYGNKNTYNYKNWKQDYEEKTGGNYQWRKNNYHSQYGNDYNYNNNQDDYEEDVDDWDGSNWGYWNEDGDWVQYTSEDMEAMEEEALYDDAFADEAQEQEQQAQTKDDDDKYADDYFVHLKEVRQEHSQMELYQIVAALLSFGAFAMLLYVCSLRSSIARRNALAAKQQESATLYEDIATMLEVSDLD